ncbi:succinyl-diaminopimelate desuccinylase [Anaplasma capra]|uniref:succinyl-diaminopimelate desuccinylase n=1 Tax=Anaplasma capra TaxID=1562740 RepID=UPI0021D5E8FF|nr:succinyl-diaminopimelate desuccinylase [Anaplasma capra]MCU7611224.1 succinyl-diaminopimelate desuccinylase [Anaplasma capra]MCU7612596.1 succinyl-diaminopimelate desuccinylase [Anaplasma capra]
MCSVELNDPVLLACELMSYPSVTPDRSEAIPFLAKLLSNLGFVCEILSFGDGDIEIKNLYAQRGEGRPNLCFAGHTDVVPPGSNAWRFDPFSPKVENGILWGRGAVDMKAAICAYISAVSQFDSVPGCLSFVITGDEEGCHGEYGTKSVLRWMKSKGIEIDYCIVGEPSSRERIGDAISIGRRGSINFKLLCRGVQGHVAYPNLTHNPINDLLRILCKINDTRLDDGSEHFTPSNCAITSVDVGNSVENVTPASANAAFTIRFNDCHTAESLYRNVDAICSSVTDKYTLSYKSLRGAFVNQPCDSTRTLLSVIKEITGLDAELRTCGGVSDACFVNEHCPTVELGLSHKTAHKANEHAPVADILALTEIYKRFIGRFFSIA